MRKDAFSIFCVFLEKLNKNRHKTPKISREKTRFHVTIFRKAFSTDVCDGILKGLNFHFPDGQSGMYAKRRVSRIYLSLPRPEKNMPQNVTTRKDVFSRIFKNAPSQKGKFRVPRHKKPATPRAPCEETFL